MRALLPSPQTFRGHVVEGIFNQMLLKHVGEDKAAELLMEAKRTADMYSDEAIARLVAFVIRRVSEPDAEKRNRPVDFQKLLDAFERGGEAPE